MGEIGEPPLPVVVPPPVRYSPGPGISVLKSVIDKVPPIEFGGADKGPVDEGGGGGEDASLPVSLSAGPDASRHVLPPSCPAVPMLVGVDLNDVIREFCVVVIGGDIEFGERVNILLCEDEWIP